MDFGIAFDQSRKDRITLTGEVVGTPGYMSPEQVAGDIEKLDGRTDVYSLGVTLYELVVGRRPFIGSTPMAILKAIQHDEPPRPRALNPRVDPEIEGVILKAMSKDPSRRYQTASEFSRDLSLFLAGEPTSAGKLTFRKIVSHKVRRHWRALGVAALAVAVAGALAYLTYELMTLRESSVPLDSRAGQTRLAYNRGMHALSEAKTLPGAAERRPLLGQALQQFTLATETDPAFIEGRRRRAELHMILARPAEAVREYESLENAASDLLRAWIRLLLVYPDYPEYRRKELEGLLRGRELSRVIESIGQYPPAVVGQVSRALGAMLRSSPREALTALGGIPASEMRAEFIALRGRAALEDGDPDRALDLLMTAVSRDPWFPEAWALLADLHARRGRFDAARDAADRACEHLEQPFPPVLHARAMTLVQWGDLKAAEDLLESAVAQAPGRADLAHDLGVVLLVRGEPRLAMDAFERALKLHPDSYVSGYMLACAIATEAKSETAVGRQRDLIVRAFKALSHSLLACEKSGGFSARGGPDLRPYERLWKLMRPRADDASRDPMLALLRLQPAWDREIRPILRRLR
jgi:tetratricopeptide (TPR) repeat protein